MPDPFVLHIGFPKAGSTALQRVFASLAHVAYLGKNDTWGRRTAARGYAATWASDAFGTFVKEIAAVYDARAVDCTPFRAAFDAVLTENAGRSVLLSDEALSSLSASLRGGGASIPQVLENFRAVVDAPITVIFVIREQRALLRSLYAQMVKGGYPHAFDGFVAAVLTKSQYWAAPVLDYSRTIPLLRDFADRAVVLQFERMVADDAWRAATLGDVLGPSPDFGVLPHMRETRDAVPVADWLAVNRAGRGWLTIPPTRYLGPDLVDRVETAETGPTLRRLRGPVRRQQREIAAWTRARRALSPGAGAGGDSYALPAPLAAHLEDLIRAWNAGLETHLPDYNWAGMGYLQ